MADGLVMRPFRYIVPFRPNTQSSKCCTMRTSIYANSSTGERRAAAATMSGERIRGLAAAPYPTPDRDADGYSEVDCRARHHGRTPSQVGSECC